MQKKQLIIGTMGLALVLTGLILFLSGSKPLTQGTISGYPVTINKTLTMSQSNGSDYIIIPVNTDMTHTLVTGSSEGMNYEPLSTYLSGLDTTVPKEIEYRSTTDEDEITVRIIISDDLR